MKPEDLLRLEERIKGINGMAGLVRAEKAVVEVDYVLGVGGFDLSLIEEQVCFRSTEILFSSPFCLWKNIPWGFFQIRFFAEGGLWLSSETGFDLKATVKIFHVFTTPGIHR